MRSKKRVGIIGVGEISDWHVRTLEAVGVEVVAAATRPGSTRLRDFCLRHQIPTHFQHWREMLKNDLKLDGLLIATHVTATHEILAEAFALGIPLLVEKPVALSSLVLSRLCDQAHDQVMVGYNRRFYRPVQFVREFIQTGEPLLAHMVLPESINVTCENGVGYLYPFFENSCHGVDLLRYLFGDLNLSSVHRLQSHDGGIRGFDAGFLSHRGDIIHLTGNWGAPANFALTLDRAGRRVELRPFEMATVYEGMDIIPPSTECPIRRYLPKTVHVVHLDEVDQREKPGFVKQAEIFRSMMEGQQRNLSYATLKDAWGVMKLCESLVGRAYTQDPHETFTSSR